MKLKLEAVSAPYGTGIVRTDRTLRLLRPPYTLQDCPILPEESVEDAILRLGFSAAEKEFTTWEEAIDFLNQQAVEWHRVLGKDIPESIPNSDIIDVAPEEILTAFLERVETDLIPRQVFDHAENVLFALLTSSAPRRYPALGGRAMELWRRNKAARRAAESAMSEVARHDLRFESLEKHGQAGRSAKLADDIKRRHCVFASCP